MTECPDCLSKIGSITKHRRICLVRNNKDLKSWLESIEISITPISDGKS